MDKDTFNYKHEISTVVRQYLHLAQVFFPVPWAVAHENFNTNFLFRGNSYFKKFEKCPGASRGGVINSVEGGGGGGCRVV